MRAQVTLQPGQKGTKKLLEKYADQLICVRYRYDEARQRQLTTVELIVEETPWRPGGAKSKGAVLAGVRVGVQEVPLQRQVKRAGGRWNPTRRVWEVRRDQALKLGWQDRMENAKVSIRRNHDVSICRNLVVPAYRNKFLHIEASFYL
ncbi:MAG: hypothetical protein HYZ81_27610 [Nitrospinae bacterium]|nr:hypothetical protein [Nitrospinota bacterium]